ncbi:DUF397 domain-containing protein [Streptomyces sp. NPDC047071]|uniref:DUF397 domain-containing protein n=1 Tax=Streptomyces sp. NPDC047071 TaxID=3154808 RepID=UPI00345269D9
MDALNWQKSTYSENASSCVYVAAGPDGTVLLRESDDPQTILTTHPAQLGTLITALKTGTAPTRGRTSQP